MHYAREGLIQLNVTITDANMSDAGEYRAEALYSDDTLISTVSATFSVNITLGNTLYGCICIVSLFLYILKCYTVNR